MLPDCRSAGFGEPKSHRGAPGWGSSDSGVPAEGSPPRVSAPLRQTAAEDDGPAVAGCWTCTQHPPTEEERAGHVSSPALTGDHAGPLLEPRTWLGTVINDLDFINMLIRASLDRK